MKKHGKKVWLVILMTVIFALIVGTAVLLDIKYNSRDKSNFFAYTIDLENENWTYAPQGLDYGMTAEEVIKAERIKAYTWEEDGVILRTEQTVKKPFGEIKELEFVKRYFFDSEGGLASVRYELIMDDDYEKAIRQMLYEQAIAYMPEPNRRTELEDIAVVGEWLSECIKVEQENLKDEGTYDENILPVTRVIWEDTVYSSEDGEAVVTHANSDVVLGIDVQLNLKLKLSLIVSRYEDRLTEEEIQALRVTYPISNEIHPLASVVIMPFEVMNHTENGDFTCVEVSDDYTTYYQTSSSKYYEYPVNVISDSKGNRYEGLKGDLYSSMNMQPYDPQVYIGMNLLMPGGVDLENTENRWRIDWSGMFYVTDSGHVLTVFGV